MMNEKQKPSEKEQVDDSSLTSSTLAITPQDNMLVCGSIRSGQLALFPHQIQQVKQLEVMDHESGGLFDYIPIKLEKLLISNDEQITDVVVGTIFTLYLSSYSRVYYCGNDSLFDDTCSKVVNKEVPNFRWVFFFDPVQLSAFDKLSSHMEEEQQEDNQLLIFVKHITCGAKHCAFLLSNHSVYMIGSNEMGQIGMGKSYSNITFPQKVEIGGCYSSSLSPKTTRRTTTNDYENSENSENSEEEDSQSLPKKRKLTSLIENGKTNHCIITLIKCSYDNTVLQTRDGFVYASGDNEYQQISHSKDKIYEFTRIFFKEMSLDQYKNIKEIIVMDNFMLALTIEGRLYISEGKYTFEKMGLDINYFNISNFPQNSITQIFKTSYAFFIRTLRGEIFYLQQGFTKMVKSTLLSYKDFIIASGRYHLVSISTNLHNEGLYEAIGYNKFGNLGFKSSEETIKVPQSIHKVTNWIRSKSLHSCSYKLAADFFNTIIYRVRDLKREEGLKLQFNLISNTRRRTGTERGRESFVLSDVLILTRFECFNNIIDHHHYDNDLDNNNNGSDNNNNGNNNGSDNNNHNGGDVTRNGSFDVGTSNDQLKHIMDMMTSGGNNQLKNNK